MKPDLRHALRHAESLLNPSAVQGARWEKPDLRHALRHAESLLNPSAMQGARWEQMGVRAAQIRLFPRRRESKSSKLNDTPEYLDSRLRGNDGN